MVDVTVVVEGGRVETSIMVSDTTAVTVGGERVSVSIRGELYVLMDIEVTVIAGNVTVCVVVTGWGHVVGPLELVVPVVEVGV